MKKLLTKMMAAVPAFVLLLAVFFVQAPCFCFVHQHAIARGLKRHEE